MLTVANVSERSRTKPPLLLSRMCGDTPRSDLRESDKDWLAEATLRSSS